ncbi:Ig-like domain-containing protein [Porticoccaceae bacterium]|nr:Ig-like domain-containing protein [Porticoccaceae bacterium]
MAQIGKESLAVKEGEEQKITLLGTNPDGTESSVFEIISLPKNGMLKDDKGNIKNKSDDPYLVIGDLFYKANSDSTESDSFTFKACDKVGCSDPTNIDITISIEDDPPKFTSKPPKLDSVNEGSQYNAQFDIEDPDSSNLTAVLEKRPEWLSFANNKDKLRIILTGQKNFSVQLEGKPENKHIDINNVLKLSIRDDKSSISYQFTIDVVNIDNTGFITIAGETIQSKALKAVLTDDDGIDGQVSYEWRRDGNKVKGVSDSYQLTQADVGAIISVMATYKDSQSGEIVSTTEAKTDQIANINDAPKIKSIPKQLIQLNERFTFLVEAEDADANKLTFSLVNKPVGMDINSSSGEITWTPTKTQPDTQVNVQVNDGTNTDNATDNISFFVAVLDDKDKNDTAEKTEKIIPSINTTPIAYDMKISANEDELVKITLEGSDADNSNEELRYKIVQQSKEGVTTEPTGADVTYTSTSDTAVSDNFTYEVCDEFLCSEKAIVSITIKPQNDLPKIVTTDIAKSIEDENYTLELKVEDPDSESLVVTLKQKPSWLSFDNNKNPIRVSLINLEGIFATVLKFKGIPQNRHVGENKITLEITDGFGSNKLVVNHEFTIIVSNTNDKGNITIEGEPKQNETLAVRVTDVDGVDESNITYQWQRGSDAIDVTEGETYKLTQEDVGSIISVNARYVDDHKTSEDLSASTFAVLNINDAPTITGDPSTTVYQDTDYKSFTPTVADIDENDTFKFSIENKPDWAEFDSNTGTLSGTPRNDHIGTKTNIEIFVRDSEGEQASLQPFSIEVINADDPPVLQTIKNKSVNEDFDSFTIDLSATDIDDDPITYDFSPKENPITNLTIEGNKLKITAIKDANGAQEITIIAKSNGKQDKEPFTLTINPKNDTPKAEAMKIDATEGESKVIKLQGSDLENTNEELIYKIIQPANEGTITALTGADFTYTGTSDTAVSDNFTYKVCDESLCSKEANVSITIKPINDAPRVVTTDIEKATEDSEYTLELKVEDPDAESLVVTLKQKPSWLSFDNNKNPIRVSLINLEGIFATVLKFKGIPQNRHVGENKITLEITDGFGSNKLVVNHEFTIIVSNTNDKGNITIEGEPKQNETLAVRVTDVDGVDESNITYQWQRGSDAIDVTEGETYKLTQEDVGSIISVNARYVDDHKTSEDLSASTFAVLNINDAPTITGDPSTTVYQDTDYKSFTPTVADIDENDTFKFSIENKPDWAEFDSNTGTLSGTPRNDHIGTKTNIEIFVRDSEGEQASLQPFSIEVINADDPPVLQTIKNKSVNEDFDSFTIDLSATDIDDDPITYDFSPKENPITNLTIEGNKLKITAIKDANGAQEITIIAKSNGKQDKEPFTLTINPKNDTPKAEAMKIDATEGESKVIKLQGSDLENTNEELIYKIIQPANEGTITALTGADFTYTGTSDTAVSDNFTYKVCDESLCSKEANVSITIKPINDAPRVVTTDIEKATEDSEYTLELKVKDPDAESLQVTFIQPDWLTLSSTSPQKDGDQFIIELTGTPRNQHVGNNQVQLQISDDRSTVSHEFNLEVTNTDDKGNLTIEGAPKQNATLRATVTDDDGITDSISYHWQHKGSNSHSATGEFYTLAQDDVNQIITVTATYTDARSDLKYSLNKSTDSIDNVNDAPTIKGVPEESVYQDNDYSFTPKANDIDANDTLKFSIENKPDWAKFDSSAGTLSGTPNNYQVGLTSGIVISVSDGNDVEARLQPFDITVVNIDDPPILHSIGDREVPEDSEIIIPLFASDIDNDVETIQFFANEIDSDKIKSLTIVSLPDTDTGRDYLKGLKIKPAKNASGIVEIQVIAKSNNKTDEETFNLEIRNVDDSGTVKLTNISGGDAKYVQKETLYAKIEDPDFDDFIYPISAQWRRNGQNIINPVGTSSISYWLTNEDVGQIISVLVTYKDMSSGYTQSAVSEGTPEIENINDAPVAKDFVVSMGSEPSDSMGKVSAELVGVIDPDIEVDRDPLTASDSKLKYKVVREPDYGEVHFYLDQSFFEYNRSNMRSSLTKDSFAYEVCDPQGLCDRATVTIYFEQRPSLKEACPSISGNKGDCITNFPLNPETERPDLTVTRKQVFKLALEIEDIDSNELTLELKEFPEWLKVTKPEGVEENTFTITKNNGEFLDVILEGIAPAKVDDNNANNSLKLTLTDKNIAKNEDLENYHFDIKYTASVTAKLTNDAVLKPYAIEARTSSPVVSNIANNQSTVTQYNLSLSKDINTIVEGEHFEFDLDKYISVHDFDIGKIKILTKEGKALPSWLNYADNTLRVNDHEELDDEEEEYQLQIFIEDPSGKKIQLFFKLLIEHKTKLIGDFRAVMVLNESYTLTDSDFFYSDDQKTSNDVEFKISGLQNIRLSGVSENKESTYTFSAKELKEGKVKLSLEESDFAYFNVEIVDNSQSTSQKTTPKNGTKKLFTIEEFLAPHLSVGLETKIFSWMTKVQTSSDIEYQYLFCSWTSSCSDIWVQTQQTDYSIESEPAGSYTLRVREIRKNDSESYYSSIAEKSMVVPTISVKDEEGNTVNKDGETSSPTVTVDIDLGSTPAEPFNPSRDIVIENGTLNYTNLDRSLKRFYTFNVRAIEEGPVIVTIPSSQYRSLNPQMTSVENAAASFQWEYGGVLQHKISSIPPNTLWWHVSLDSDVKSFNYYMVKIDKHFTFMCPDQTLISHECNPGKIRSPDINKTPNVIEHKWENDADDELVVSLQSIENNDYLLTMKGTGKYTLQIPKKDEDDYKLRRFIPQIRVFEKVEVVGENNNKQSYKRIVTSNTMAGLSIDKYRKSSKNKVFIEIDTIFYTKDFTVDNIHVNNGTVIGSEFKKIIGQTNKYQVEIEDIIENEDVTVTIKKDTYQDGYKEVYNQAAQVSWSYDKDYKVETFIEKKEDDWNNLETIFYNKTQLRVHWPDWVPNSKTVGMDVNFIEQNNCRNTEDICSFNVNLKSEVKQKLKNCNDDNKSSDCDVRVSINNPDGDLIEIVAWDYSPQIEEETPANNGNTVQILPDFSVSDQFSNRINSSLNSSNTEQAVTNAREVQFVIKDVKNVGKNIQEHTKLPEGIRIENGSFIGHISVIGSDEIQFQIRVNEPLEGNKTTQVKVHIAPNIGKGEISHTNEATVLSWTYAPDDSNNSLPSNVLHIQPTLKLINNDKTTVDNGGKTNQQELILVIDTIQPITADGIILSLSNANMQITEQWTSEGDSKFITKIAGDKFGNSNEIIISANSLNYKTNTYKNLKASFTWTYGSVTKTNNQTTNKDDDLYYNGQDNIIDGKEGKDKLDGGYGDDQIRGGDGDDLIIGSYDNDTLTGDGGQDTFCYKKDDGSDVIKDFNHEQDTLLLAFLGLTEEDTQNLNEYQIKYKKIEQITIEKQKIVVEETDNVNFKKTINIKYDNKLIISLQDQKLSTTIKQIEEAIQYKDTCVLSPAKEPTKDRKFVFKELGIFSVSLSPLGQIDIEIQDDEGQIVTDSEPRKIKIIVNNGGKLNCISKEDSDCESIDDGIKLTITPEDGKFDLAKLELTGTPGKTYNLTVSADNIDKAIQIIKLHESIKDDTKALFETDFKQVSIGGNNGTTISLVHDYDYYKENRDRLIPPSDKSVTFTTTLGTFDAADKDSDDKKITLYPDAQGYYKATLTSDKEGQAEITASSDHWNVNNNKIFVDFYTPSKEPPKLHRFVFKESGVLSVSGSPLRQIDIETLDKAGEIVDDNAQREIEITVDNGGILNCISTDKDCEKDRLGSSNNVIKLKITPVEGKFNLAKLELTGTPGKTYNLTVSADNIDKAIQIIKLHKSINNDTKALFKASLKQVSIGGINSTTISLIYHYERSNVDEDRLIPLSDKPVTFKTSLGTFNNADKGSSGNTITLYPDAQGYYKATLTSDEAGKAEITATAKDTVTGFEWTDEIEVNFYKSDSGQDSSPDLAIIGLDRNIVHMAKQGYKNPKPVDEDKGKLPGDRNIIQAAISLRNVNEDHRLKLSINHGFFENNSQLLQRDPSNQPNTEDHSEYKFRFNFDKVMILGKDDNTPEEVTFEVTHINDKPYSAGQLQCQNRNDNHCMVENELVRIKQTKLSNKLTNDNQQFATGEFDLDRLLLNDAVIGDSIKLKLKFSINNKEIKKQLAVTLVNSTKPSWILVPGPEENRIFSVKFASYTFGYGTIRATLDGEELDTENYQFIHEFVIKDGYVYIQDPHDLYDLNPIDYELIHELRFTGKIEKAITIEDLTLKGNYKNGRSLIAAEDCANTQLKEGSLLGEHFEVVTYEENGCEFNGQEGDDIIEGGLADDLLIGGAGKDEIFGGLGDDFISGGKGNDTIMGNEGSDSFCYQDGDGNDVIKDYNHLEDSILLIGIDKKIVTEIPSDPNDPKTQKIFIVQYDGETIIELQDQTGSVTKENISNTIKTLPAVFDVSSCDAPKALKSGYLLEGSKKMDTLRGGVGDDIIIGGEGDDRIVGGDGKDRFCYNNGDGIDVIEDFNHKKDSIFLFGIDEQDVTKDLKREIYTGKINNLTRPYVFRLKLEEETIIRLLVQPQSGTEITDKLKEEIYETIKFFDIDQTSECHNPTVTITITGKAIQGQTLETQINNIAEHTVNYQWRANGDAITNAINETYTLTANEVDKEITVEVTYKDTQGEKHLIRSIPTEEIFTSSLNNITDYQDADIEGVDKGNINAIKTAVSPGQMNKEEVEKVVASYNKIIDYGGDESDDAISPEKSDYIDIGIKDLDSLDNEQFNLFNSILNYKNEDVVLERKNIQHLVNTVIKLSNQPDQLEQPDFETLSSSVVDKYILAELRVNIIEPKNKDKLNHIDVIDSLIDDVMDEPKMFHYLTPEVEFQYVEIEDPVGSPNKKVLHFVLDFIEEGHFKGDIKVINAAYSNTKAIDGKDDITGVKHKVTSSTHSDWAEIIILKDNFKYTHPSLKNNKVTYIWTYSLSEKEVSETQSKIVVEDQQKSIIANGTSTTTITIELKNNDGNPITGKKVTLNTDIGTFKDTPLKNKQSIVAIEKGNGIYEASMTSEKIGAATITADLNGSVITAEKVVEFKAGEAAYISDITREDNQIDNFGDPVKSSFSVTITDKFRNPVNNQEVTFTVDGGGDIADSQNPNALVVSTNDKGIATLKSGLWVLGKPPNSQTLTASINDKDKSSTIKANTRSLVITLPHLNDKLTEIPKYKIHIGDFINKEFNKIKDDHPLDELIEIEKASYTEIIHNAVFSKSFDDRKITLNLRDEEHTDAAKQKQNQSFAEKLRKNITTKGEISLGSEFNVKISGYNCSENKPTFVGKTASGNSWYVAAEQGGYELFAHSTKMTKYNIAKQNSIYPKYHFPFKYSSHHKEMAYKDCVKEDEKTHSFIAPSMAIANGGTLPPIEVKFKDKDNQFIGFGNHEVTVSVSDATDGKLICVEGTDHCQNARLESKQGSNIQCNTNGRSCTIKASNGIANFKGLVLKGQVGKIYSLQFTSGELTTVNDNKSQVYIHKAGKVSIEKSLISPQIAPITAGDTATITVNLTDDYGNPVEGKNVILETNLGLFDKDQSNTVAKDNNDGTYTATLTSKKAGLATITAKADGQLIKSNASVNFIAGLATKLKFIQPPSDTTTNGEPLEQQPIIQLIDPFENPIKQKDIKITAKILGNCPNIVDECRIHKHMGSASGDANKFDLVGCTSYQNDCLKGSLEVMTNNVGKAVFTDLFLIGGLGEEYTLQFMIEGKNHISIDHMVDVVKAGNLAQIKITPQELPEFSSESTLDQIKIELKDSSGNLTKPIDNKALNIELNDGANAKLSCKESYSDCTLDDNGKINLKISKPTTMLDAVILEGKVGTYTLKVSQGDINRTVNIEITNGGKVSKIVVSDSADENIYIVDINENNVEAESQSLCKNSPYVDTKNPYLEDGYNYCFLGDVSDSQIDNLKFKIKVIDKYFNSIKGEVIRIKDTFDKEISEKTNEEDIVIQMKRMANMVYGISMLVSHRDLIHPIKLEASYQHILTNYKFNYSNSRTESVELISIKDGNKGTIQNKGDLVDIQILYRGKGMPHNEEKDKFIVKSKFGNNTSHKLTTYIFDDEKIEYPKEVSSKNSSIKVNATTEEDQSIEFYHDIEKVSVEVHLKDDNNSNIDKQYIKNVKIEFKDSGITSTSGSNKSNNGIYTFIFDSSDVINQLVSSDMKLRSSNIRVTTILDNDATTSFEGKAGKPSKLTIHKKPGLYFESESHLLGEDKLYIKITDSNFNTPDLTNITKELQIEIISNEKAEFECDANGGDSTCSVQNGKKITAKFDSNPIFINSIIFSGKIGTHTLKATVGAIEQQFIINIEKPGPLGPGSKIVIKDRENICKKRDKKVVWTNETCFLGFVHDNETKQATLTVTDKHGNAKQHQKFYVYMNYTGGNFAELKTDANGDYKIEFKPGGKSGMGIFNLFLLHKPDNTTFTPYKLKNKPYADALIFEAGKHHRHYIDWSLTKTHIFDYPQKGSSRLYSYIHLNPQYGETNAYGHEGQHLEYTVNDDVLHENMDLNDIIIIENIIFDENYKKAFTALIKREFKLQTDEYYPYQWYLHDFDQGGISLNKAILLGYDRAENESVYTGEDITIGIVGDEMRNHPDLSVELANTNDSNFIISNKDDSTRGESTNVAGIVGATGWNTVGIRGIVPEAKLINIFGTLAFLSRTTKSDKLDLLQNQYDQYDQYNLGEDTIEYEPIDIYLITENGYSALTTKLTNKASIIFSLNHNNGSLNEKTSTTDGYTVLSEKAIAVHNSSIFIRGAGDDFKQIKQICNNLLPCQQSAMSNHPIVNYPPLINVAAITKNKRKATYSVLSSANWISAPGGEEHQNEDIITTCEREVCNADYTDNFASTSASAAIVTGVVALMLEENPKLDWRDIKYILAKTAVQIDENDNGWIPNNAGYKFHHAYGFGAIDAEATLKKVKNYTENLGELQKIPLTSITKPNELLKLSENITSSTITIKQNLYVEFLMLEIRPAARNDLDERLTNELEHLSQRRELSITSPSGTIFSHTITGSDLEGMFRDGTGDVKVFKILVNQFFGERSAGDWTITLSGGDKYNEEVLEWVPTIYGTEIDISKNPTAEPN